MTKKKKRSVYKDDDHFKKPLETSQRHMNVKQCTDIIKKEIRDLIPHPIVCLFL